MTDLEKIGLEAVDKFITTWNSRDATEWATSLHFPHVRPSSSGPIQVANSAKEYVRNVDFNKVIETGWDHSEWDYKRVIHTSINKIHVAGQWSRYNTDGEIFLTTPVAYIVTRLDERWGIQSRFGTDYAGDEDTSGFESRAFRHMENFIHHLNNRNMAACAELLNYPHFVINKGELDQTLAADKFRQDETTTKVDSLMAVQAGLHSANLALDLSVSNASGTRHLQAVVLVTNRNNHLGIQAWSLLDPTEEEEEEE